jgi:hypothetical protein
MLGRSYLCGCAEIRKVQPFGGVGASPICEPTSIVLLESGSNCICLRTTLSRATVQFGLVCTECPRLGGRSPRLCPGDSLGVRLRNQSSSDRSEIHLSSRQSVSPGRSFSAVSHRSLITPLRHSL